jgi:UPF0716 protein FxsA
LQRHGPEVNPWRAVCARRRYKLEVGKFFLAFAALPFLDLYVLVRLGKAFGGALPILLVLGSGVLGAVLMRVAGLRVVDAWRRALAQGAPPSDSVFSGVLMLLGCALFIMPGVLSDTLGATLMIPAVRRSVARHVGQQMFAAMQRGTVRTVEFRDREARMGRRPEPHRAVIDVEAEVVNEKTVEEPRQLKS